MDRKNAHGNKHTPAPWESKCMFIPSKRDPVSYKIVDAVGDVLAIVRREDVPQSIAEANAQLIAAAPEMLEALKELFEHCAMVHNQWGDGDNTKQADEAIKKAKDAIAKAERTY